MKSRNKKKFSGSVMILTLVMVGILSAAIGIMLYAVRNLARSSDDRIAYEEAYHVALSGLTLTKSWMSNPSPATQQMNSTVGGKIQKLTSGTIAFAEYCRDNSGTVNTTIVAPSQCISPFFTQYDTSFATGSNLDNST